MKALWSYLTSPTVLACFFVSLTINAHAADVLESRDSWGNPVVLINGEIRLGDTERVKRAAADVLLSVSPAERKELQFQLNTPGGDVEEAIKLGRFFRFILARVNSYGRIIVAEGSKEADIVVNRRAQFGLRPDTDLDYVVLSRDAPLSEQDIVRNYSAGIIAFYGAVERAHRDNSDQREGFAQAVSIPVMGIHRPYFSKDAFAKLSPGDAEKAYAELERHVRSYMLEMGAPQELLDRMFERASNEIDLVPASEFRKFYKSKESFLDEWLIAKCGSTRDLDGLTAAELKDFKEIEAEQIRARIADKSGADRPALYLYPSASFPSTYVEQLYSKVRSRNRDINRCYKTALVDHQSKWANSYRH